MTNLSPARGDRIGGLALFAAATFALGLGLIYALERIGAPDAFVEALGPILSLVGLAVIGATARAANLPDFLAAGRAVPTLYAGLAFAASASGLIVAIFADPTGAGATSWRGVAAGAVIAALWVAPRWRRLNASSVADVLATRFPAWWSRVVFTLLLAAIGILTAIAGFDLAADAIAPVFGFNPRAARGLVMFALAVSVAPGGLKSLLWSDAASAGAALLIGAVGAALQPDRATVPFESLRQAWSDALVSSSPDPRVIWAQLATLFAVASFFALAAPALGVESASRARRAGLAGLALAAIGVGLATIALANPSSAAESSRTAAALTAAAAWLPALALARAGVLGVSRARGIDLATAHAALSVLASRRIALGRGAALIVVALCPLLRDVGDLDAGRAIFLALAIGLAFVTPSLVLTLTRAASSAAAATAVAISFATAAARIYVAGHLPVNGDLLSVAAVVGISGLVTGGVAAILFPARRPSAPADVDPFAASPSPRLGEQP